MSWVMQQFLVELPCSVSREQQQQEQKFAGISLSFAVFNAKL